MPDEPEEPDDRLHTGELHELQRRIRKQDRAACNELLLACQDRLEALARKMFRRSKVVRWAEVEDLLPNVSLRLLRALESTDVRDTRHFFALAANAIRHELGDMYRHFFGPRGIGANHASVPPGEDGRPRYDPPAPEDRADEDRWAALHAAADNLPAEEREAFGLVFYHGWTRARIAELFGVSEKAIYNRLKRAADLLETALGGELPAE